MRVLVIANNFPWPDHPFDGIFNLRQLLALQRQGWEARVLRCVPWRPRLHAKWLRYRSVPERYVVEGVPVRALWGLLGPRGWGIGTLGYQLSAPLAAEIATFRPDVIHAQGLLHAGVLARATGKPYLITAHGSEAYRLPWTRPALMRDAQAVLRDAARVCAVSNFVAEHLQRLGRSDARVIFNGADHRIFFPQDRAQARRRLNLSERPTIAFVGHLEREKGLFELLEAAESLNDLAPQLVLAGTGTAREALEASARERGVRAIFLGARSQEELTDVYAAADVFALPSYAEGLPSVLCEAMNCARAIVATAVGGVPEIVADGERGFVVPPRDAQALAARLRTVLTDDGLRARMERGAVAYGANLTWDANAAQYDALYRELAARAAVVA